MKLRKIMNGILKGGRYSIGKINPALNRPDIPLVRINLEYFLAREILASSDFFFVQIGANDGKRADDSYEFIVKHHLRGIVVEPLADMFAKLTENYKSEPQIQKVNKAIHADAASMVLYRIKEDAGVPDWCHGIGSFNRDHLLSGARKVPDIEKYIVEERVECISLPDLFASSDVNRISFLQIDTEGYDFEIIKMIDFAIIKPRIIRYECSVMSKADNQACVDLLRQHGYRFFDEGNDIIAVL